VRLVLVFGLLLVSGWLPLPSSAQEILTNESILTMVRAGLPEGVIVAKIRSSQTKFDLSTDALIALKQAGVPDRVLEEMAGRGAAPTPSAVPPPAVPGVFGVAVPTGGGLLIYHVDAGKLVELKPVAGKLETTFAPFFGKQELVIPSRRSDYRITDRQPTFQAANFSPEVQLTRLRPGGKDDRNLKLLSLPPFGGTISHGPDEDVIVKIVTERDAQGWVRIRPNAPLLPGEYGFVLGMRIWDFGVD